MFVGFALGCAFCWLGEFGLLGLKLFWFAGDCAVCFLGFVDFVWFGLFVFGLLVLFGFTLRAYCEILLFGLNFFWIY